MKPKVRTCLWYDGNGEEAAELYVSLLPDSRVESALQRNAEGRPLIVEFTLAGVPFMALNGGPRFKHGPAASIAVLTKDQDETDRLWNALIADGGEESMCGWLADRFGVSWQICPERVMEMVNSKDRAAAGRAFDALMGMRKLDIAGVEKAYGGSG